ncbi:MAG: transcriptional repressor [Oscillatoria sp. SIO1A7]|nr:transcriptional repressor [Oscillatoria sp. SIO1A7]
MVSYTKDSLRANLNAKGQRLTPQRQEILDIFQNLADGNHLSAEEVYEKLRGKRKRISLSTVYRNLKLMAGMGILRELALAEGHKTYELNQPDQGDRHHHLVCLQCNRTIEFKNDLISKASLKQAKKSGYEILDSQLTIQAICPEALRQGWPMLPDDWLCLRAASDSEPS